MSAQDQMRAMLDQLMGTTRNGGSSQPEFRFYDSRVCKSFLLHCCPHEILASTCDEIAHSKILASFVVIRLSSAIDRTILEMDQKAIGRRMDLGDCPKYHNFALRADFAQAQKTKDYYYDIDAMEHLQSFVADCDRRTELAKQRLLETQEELTAEVATKANNVHELAEKIGQKLAEAERLGEEGMVDDSMKLMAEVDDLRKTKATAEQEYRTSMPASSYQQQKLRVCEVCSAYLGIHDNDRRLADHFGGKLHLGFIKIRDKLAELEKSVEERRKARREMMDKESKDQDRERLERRRERDRGSRERDRGDRERSRERERDRGDRHSRSRNDDSRSRSHHRSRSRSGDRRRSHRDDRERDSDRRRDRSRDRNRDRRAPADN